MRMPEIEKVIFNDPATIVLWSDGTKTVVKTHDEPYSKEHGLAMCIARRYFRDNRSKFKKAVDGKLDFDRNRDPYTLLKDVVFTTRNGRLVEIR